MKFRDVSTGLRILRDFLLGNREPHQLHNRFNPLLAPRTLPRPEIARSSVDRYSNVYYCDRNPIAAVKPPVVAPIALGLKQSAATSKQLSGKQEPGAKPCPEGPLVFPNIPAPGPTYWWDGHCYFESTADPPPKKKASPKPQPPPCPPPDATRCPPMPPKCDPCAGTNPCESIKKC